MRCVRFGTGRYPACLRMTEAGCRRMIVLPGADDAAESIFAGLTPDSALLTVDGIRWNEDLSPWPAPALRGNEDFAGGAGHFLNILLEDILPEAEHLAAPMNFEQKILGGYSLAGLFALWSGTQTDAFDAVAAMSPSVWYDGFADWLSADERVFLPRFAFLSLGDQEKRTGNRRMASVEDDLIIVRDMLEQKGVETALRMENGGHFKDVPGRMLRGIRGTIDLMDSSE